MNQLEQPDRRAVQPDPFMDVQFVGPYIHDQVIRANVLPYVFGGPLRVLETGSFGREAIWAARLGHDVQVVEDDKREAAIALDRIAGAGLAGQIAVHAGDISELVAEDQEPYDLILSRYFYGPRRQPDHHVQTLGELVASDGIVSIVATSRRSVFGRNKIIRGENSVQSAIERSGLHVDTVYGAAFKHPGMMQMAVAPRVEVDKIIAAELELSRDPLRWSMGNIAHFICTREIENEYGGEE